jgi:hypothetical protein
MDNNINEITFGFRDEFKRKQIAENLIKLFNSEIDTSPTVVDGVWGSGKTEFCHKLKNLIKSQSADSHVIYVDAFQADHADEPLITILADIIKILPDNDNKKTLKEKALPFVKIMMKESAKAGVSWAFRKDFEALNDSVKDGLESTINEFIDISADLILKEHIELNENLEALKSILKKISNEKKIYIFVDELDRCRPNYTIRVLEVIKHIFDIENIQIILSVNKNQLKSSIQHSYGQNIDADKYFDKFVKLSVSLPNETKVNSVKTSLNSFQHFIQLISKNKSIPLVGTTDGSRELFEILFDNNYLSLREVECFERNIRVMNTIYNNLFFDNNEINFIINIMSLFIISVNKELANKILQGEFAAPQLFNVIGINKTDKKIEELSGIELFLLGLIFRCDTNLSELGLGIGYIEKIKVDSSTFFTGRYRNEINYQSEIQNNIKKFSQFIE